MMPAIAPVADAALLRAADGFFRRPDIRGNLEWLRAHLPAEAEIFVAGGALRNMVIHIFHGSAPPTRDIDIFIGGLPRDFSLTGALTGQSAEPTDLKGVRWHPVSSVLAYDLCLLPDFLVIDFYHLDPTLENLLAGIDLTINAITYDVLRQTLLEKGCTAAVRERRIDFNSRLIPDKGLIAYRILLMAHKTGFHLAPPAFQYLREQLTLENLGYVKRLLRAKVGKAAAAAIMGAYDDLCRCPSYEAYRHGQQP